MQTAHAHSRPGRPEATWETLEVHVDAVAELAARHAEAFGWQRIAALAGRLHDIGKVSGAFQAYIRAPDTSPRCDHSTAGARRAASRIAQIGRTLAYAIAGHHAGLADAGSLDERLDASRTTITPIVGWEAYIEPLPNPAALRPERLMQHSRHTHFTAAFLIRMLFSCLVDADFIATERFYAEAEGRAVDRGSPIDAADLLPRFWQFFEAQLQPSRLNTLRSAIRDHAVA